MPKSAPRNKVVKEGQQTKKVVKKSEAVATPATKTAATSKALKAQVNSKRTIRARKFAETKTSAAFRRPHTLRQARVPKFPRRSIPHRPLVDASSILKFPLASETAMATIEDNNTLVFIVDGKANKLQIRDAVKRTYDVQVVKVNTLIRPDGTKKAFVKLSPENDALETANKIGLV